MKNIFCIIGAGDMSGTQVIIPDGAYIIAADAGLSYLERFGITPDLIVGDFDSLGRIPEGKNVLAQSPEKDDTDMMIAVKEALKRGADTILIYGGMGGRLDHVLANLQTLSYIADNGARGYLIGCGTVCTVIKNGGLAFSSDMQGIISVFCHGSTAKGVTLSGLKYPLTDYTLTCSIPIGVSNEFTGKKSSVFVREGSIIVMWNSHCIEFGKITEF